MGEMPWSSAVLEPKMMIKHRRQLQVNLLKVQFSCNRLLL